LHPVEVLHDVDAVTGAAELCGVASTGHVALRGSCVCGGEGVATVALIGIFCARELVAKSAAVGGTLGGCVGR
jgi:hypothetical protein